MADPPIVTTIGDDVSGYGGLALVLVALVVVIALLWLVLPLLVFGAGVVFATAALLARLLSLSAWTVRAQQRDVILTWRVRGLLRSRRVLAEVAEKLATGQEPAIGGVAGKAE